MLDEAARPQGQAGHRRRDFFWPKPVLMLVEPEQPVLGRRTNGRGPRWRRPGPWNSPGFRRFSGRRPRRWQRPGQGAEAGACPTSRRIGLPGSRGFARRLPHAPRGWPCPAEDLGRGHSGLGAGRGGPEGVGPAGPSGSNRGQGHGTATNRLWRQAEGLWDQATAAEGPGICPIRLRVLHARGAASMIGSRPRRLWPRRARLERSRHGPRPGGCCSAARASRSWIRSQASG